MSAEQIKNLNNRVSNLEKAVHKLEAVHAPRQQDDTTPPCEPDPTEENERAVPKPPAASYIAPPKKDAKAPDGKWYKSAGWRVLRFVWRFKFLEGVGIIAVIVYTSLTWFQWHDLRHNFEVDQRSYVRIGLELPGTIFTSPGISLPMGLRNNGKSPALRTRLNAIVEIINSSSAPTFSFNKPHTISDIALLFPGDVSENIPVAIGMPNKDRTPPAITPSEIQDLVDGKTYIAAYAVVQYFDQFGEHWTHFCTWKSYSTKGGSVNADYCVQWNTIGDGKPPE